MLSRSSFNVSSSGLHWCRSAILGQRVIARREYCHFPAKEGFSRSQELQADVQFVFRFEVVRQSGGGVCPGGKLPHWGGLGRLMARVGWLQQRQKSVGSSLLRSKDRQHGTVCQHRCDHHSQDMTLRAFRHELKSHLFFNTGPSTVDRRRLDCLHGAVYKCHLYAAPCVCVRLNWTELLS